MREMRNNSPFQSRDEVVLMIVGRIRSSVPAIVNRCGRLDESTSISDLGLDSLLLLEIIMAIEDDIRAPLDERELAKAKTLGAIADLVLRERRPQSSLAPRGE
jgi:acyl carrier protein